MCDFSLNYRQKCILLLLSFMITAFGQPASIGGLGLIAACCGYALFWRVLLSLPRKLSRFCTGTFWFAAVQVVQLSWAVSHPYLYIYIVLILVVTFIGAQWGLVSLWIIPRTFQRVSSLIALAGLWVVLEWSRLFVMSGFPFNPIGLALTGSIYPLQLASIGGIFLLSFFVMLTNLLALQAWISGTRRTFGAYILLALSPYLFGMWQIYRLDHYFDQNSSKILLVQTGFPVEQKLTFHSSEEARKFVFSQWQQIFKLVLPYRKSALDLILLPENLVPYGTYGLVFPLDETKDFLFDLFGEEVIYHLPPLKYPYADFIPTEKGVRWMVNNAFLSQTLANFFNTHLIIGLEDQDDQKNETYSAAMHFQPNSLEINRYEKRVLVPMGEYIPSEYCREIAAKYGVYGSFTPGSQAKLFNGHIPLGTSICYEEAFGHKMRDNRLKGAEILVNLTNDGWYPNSSLPQQHFDHARLRTVENGIPLARACNTGITGGIDSLGRIVATLGNTPEEAQNSVGALKVDLPKFHYQTLYTIWGDYFVVSLSFVSMLFACLRNKED